MKPIWLLLKTTDAAYADAIAKCEVEHKSLFPDHELSVRLSNDEFLALVKVCIDEDAFIDTIQESVLSKVYTEETHGDALDLVNTPEWTVDEGDYHGE